MPNDPEILALITVSAAPLDAILTRGTPAEPHPSVGVGLSAERPRSLTLERSVAGLMAVQAGLGLAFRSAYRDVEWIRVTWLGNDAITLVMAAVLATATTRAAHSERAWVVLLGALAYAVYNNGYYLFGAALNVFLPLYVVILLASSVALGRALARPLHRSTAERFRPVVPTRVLGGWLLFLAAGLSVVWLMLWAAHVFTGRPTPIEPEAFKLVFAMDTAVMIPTLAVGGLALWRKSGWGPILGGLAAVLGASYLFVLLVNAGLMIQAGLAQAPGEVPAWLGLFLPTLLVAVGVVQGVGARAVCRGHDSAGRHSGTVA